jgi:hypothetical protein
MLLDSLKKSYRNISIELMQYLWNPAPVCGIFLLLSY